MPGRLAGKVAVITGGGKGIGRGVGLRFAAEGAALALGQRDAATLSATVAELEEGGGRAIGLVTDVREQVSVERLVAAAATQLGDIDILVTSAGIGSRPGGEFLDMGIDYWRDYIETNLTGTFLACQTVARHMVARGSHGRIITLGSINAWLTQPRASAYSASKGGVWTLTRAMAWELAPHDIAVNMIAPGPIRVDRTEPMQDTPEFAEMLERFVAVGRTGVPEDCASAAVYLASDDCTFVTGAVLPVDGGLLAGMPR